MKNSIQSPEGYYLDKRSNLSPLNRLSLVLDPLELSKMALEIVYGNHQFSLKLSLNKVLILFKKYKRIIEASVCNTCSNVLNLGNPNCKKTHL